MKTLLFTLEYPPFRGGVANYYGYLTKYWPIDEKILVLDNSRGELIKKNFFPAWLPALFVLKRKVEKSKINYVLVGQVLPLGTVTFILSLFRPLKYGVILHGMDFTSALANIRKKFITRLILGRADKIICANHYLAEKVKQFNPQWSNRVKVVNPGVEAGVPTIDKLNRQKLKDEYNLDNKFIIFSLGRLIIRKGVDMVIKSLATIPEEIREKIIYIIAGEGPAREYLEHLVTPDWRGKIKFLGGIKESDKWLWLNLCDIFIMPARKIDNDFEGFGIVYLEANLSSKPVIAGDSGGVSDAVESGVNGLLVNPNSTEEIKAALIKLFNDPELRKKMGQRGWNRAVKDFNWEGQVAKISQLIK